MDQSPKIIMYALNGKVEVLYPHIWSNAPSQNWKGSDIGDAWWRESSLFSEVGKLADLFSLSHPLTGLGEHLISCANLPMFCRGLTPGLILNQRARRPKLQSADRNTCAWIGACFRKVNKWPPTLDAIRHYSFGCAFWAKALAWHPVVLIIFSDPR